MTFEEALGSIASRAHAYDLSNDWPVVDLTQLHAAGAMQWAIPAINGGLDLPALELHRRYEQLASASVATALILTQRDAAVGLIEAAVDSQHRAGMLNRLAKNEIWATVGIAQLTTSRQGGTPAVQASRVEGGYLLNGIIPWCTAAHQSGLVVAGATMEDRSQILFLLQQNQAGTSLGEPMALVALTCTLTSEVRLNNVMIEDQWVLRHPCENALAGRRNSLTLGQTFIATGLTQSALNLLAGHDSDRARAAHEALANQLRAVRAEVIDLCQPGREAGATAANARLRGTCNDLALRATATAVALYKGAALLKNHPAQRLSREAMFLLVWSCPNAVIDCTVDLLTK
jgi:alkylation response protein AidB-like acyl-CoA dehydrogenase